MLDRAVHPNDTAGNHGVEFRQWSDRDAGMTVSVDLAASARLVDVRLATLQAVVRAVAHRSGGARDQPIRFATQRDLHIGGRHQGTVTLAQARLPLTGIEHWLIRRAHVFSARATEPEPLAGERLLRELATDALEDLRSGNWPVLEKRIDTLATLHGFLLRLHSLRQEDRRRVSLGPQPRDLPDWSIGDRWASTYEPLIQAAVMRLPESLPAFRWLAWRTATIGREAGPSVPPEALMATDRRLVFLAYRLYDRGAEAAGRPVELGGVARAPMALPGTAPGWYDEAWRDLSAAWEAVLQDRVPRAREDVPQAAQWALCQEHKPALIDHLRATTDLVAKAAAIGDLLGGRRALDLLLRWVKPFSDDCGPREGLHFEPGSVPVGMLGR
jgi:hypothetical protein